MARVGFLLFLAVVVYAIAATWLFVLALVLTVAIVKHVRTWRPLAGRPGSQVPPQAFSCPARYPEPRPGNGAGLSVPVVGPAPVGRRR